jgi:hypothetical protein
VYHLLCVYKIFLQWRYCPQRRTRYISLYVDIYSVHSGARTQAQSDGGHHESTRTRSWFVGIAAFFPVGVHSAESAIPIEQSICHTN